MLSNLIQQWLDEDGAFSQGVHYYQQCGGAYPYSYFRGFLQQKYIQSAIKQELRRQLQRYVQAHPPTEIEKRVPTTKKAEPAAIATLRQRAKKLHKEQGMLHAQLSTVQSDQERFDLAWRIMVEVIPGLDQIYDQIREFEVTGVLPAEPVASDLVREIVEKMQRVYSLRSRVSRLRGLLKKPLEQGKRKEYEQELKEKEDLLGELEGELGL